MAVQSTPDELAGDVLQPELKVGMLKDGVMASVVGGLTDRFALLLSDLPGLDDARRVTSARGGNRRIVGALEIVS
jgi:hypothetical protein